MNLNTDELMQTESQAVGQTDEVLTVLRSSGVPMATSDIFAKCKSFEQPGDISKIVYALRQSGRVILDGKREHPVSGRITTFYRLATDADVQLAEMKKALPAAVAVKETKPPKAQRAKAKAKVTPVPVQEAPVIIDLLTEDEPAAIDVEERIKPEISITNIRPALFADGCLLLDLPGLGLLELTKKETRAIERLFLNRRTRNGN